MFRPLLFEATFADSPSPYHHPAGVHAGDRVLEQIDRALGERPGEYCAVIVEPLVQAAGGIRTQPEGFLRQVRRLTRKHGVLMIADEVATGFCRTGKLFACDHEAVTPDLMCLGKGLTGGYLPVAATLATAEVFEAFCGDGAGRTFFHGHTFTGNALGCAAGVASVDLIFSSRLLEALPAKVNLMAARLKELAGHPHVGDIRQCGLMVGIELVADRDAQTPFEPARRVGAEVCRLARYRGLMIRPLGDVVVLMPAPAMDTDTLGRMMSAAVETIVEYFKDSA
jgi:adenosylmethionine-8-amino-7-oxononanoate aminotransferase